VWNEFKLNLSSSRVYLKELFFFDLSFIIIVYFVFGISNLFIILIIFFILLSIVLLNFLGERRLRELNNIKQVIFKIRKN